VQQQLHPATIVEALMTASKTLTERDLDHFTGSATSHQHPLVPDIFFTAGTKYVADHGGAYWLLAEIARAQRTHKHIAAAPSQFWTLTVRPDRSATLICEDGDADLLLAKIIPFTDFPLRRITFWLVENTIHLPRER
jgi:hypothetical protein